VPSTGTLQVWIARRLRRKSEEFARKGA